MNRLSAARALPLAFAVGLTLCGRAGAQSYQNPYNLPLIGPVQSAGSDARSRDFMQNVMPAFTAFIEENLQEASEFQGAPEFVLDPTKLCLPFDTDRPIRVYFLYEGAWYQNQLGLAIVDAGHGRDGQTPLIDPLSVGKLVFPDASFKYPPDGLWPGGPLFQGDFVEIGNVERGKQLDFFLVSNGARGGRAVLRNFKELNPHGLQHIIAVSFPHQHPGYVMIGFEDMVGGGDLDYNDCLFVIDFGYNIFLTEDDLPH